MLFGWETSSVVDTAVLLPLYVVVRFNQSHIYAHTITVSSTHYHLLRRFVRVFIWRNTSFDIAPSVFVSDKQRQSVSISLLNI